MSQQQSHAEEIFTQAMAEHLQTLTGNFAEPEKALRSERVIDLFTQALNSGIKGEQEVACHLHLGNLFWQKIRSSGEEPAKTSDLLDCPIHQRTLTELETALWLDAQIGGAVLRNRIQQALALPKLDVLWAAIQCVNIKKQYGLDAALKYVYSKVKMLEHLNNIPLPGLYLKMGYYLIENKQISTGVEWLKGSVTAEEYADFEGEEKSAPFKMAQYHKNQARKLLDYYMPSR